MLEKTNLAKIHWAAIATKPHLAATGSAAAALSAYLGDLEKVSQSFEISQGVKMGRPSKILATVEVDDGRYKEVTIAGSAVKVMQGQLTI